MTILEIGSWTGVSAEIFAQNFNYVFCVDPWEATEGINTQYDMREVEKIFDNRISKYKNVVKIKTLSEKAREQAMQLRIDIVYIDGCHTYEAVKEDITLWKDKCKIISGHDYWPKKFPGVIKAVDEILGKPDKVFPDTSWIKELI
jgi:hypothetical protein